MEGLKFSPATLVVHRGDTIRFKNLDIIPHTATEMGSKLFDSGMINAGAEWKFVAESTGTFRYHCLYHPEMGGVITVEAPATAGGASES
jgi:plastocyanin